MVSPFDNLTAEQRAAVTDTRDSEVGIIAGPGTGKTHTLAARAAYLIEAGADPASILILTFTRSAASSIAERVAATCQRKIEARTFHGYAARHVLADGERVATEIEEDAAFRSLYTGAAKRDGIPGKRELRELISMEEAHEAYPLLAGTKAMSILEHRLKCAGLVPTWILLKRLGEMIAADDVKENRIVLIDEAQDMTPREIGIVSRISSSVFAVGDPRQAIFGWRGAVDPNGGEKTWLENAYHDLSRSFRFGEAIASYANQIAARMVNDGRIVGCDKPSEVIAADPSRVLDAIESRNHVAVLCRTHRDCEKACADLNALDIPTEHIKRDPADALSDDDDKIASAHGRGNVVVTTVHTMKGREADVVVIDDSVYASVDPMRSTREVTLEDWRVLFVAATRAKATLMIGGDNADAF